MPRRFDQPPPPDALPPAEVRFLDLRVEPWPDNRRIKVLIHLTPFQEFPNLEVTLLDQENEELARASIIENTEAKLVFTMHLRGAQPGEQEYTLRVSIGYPDLPDVDRAEIRFTLL
jgi:hypothetical protein